MFPDSEIKARGLIVACLLGRPDGATADEIRRVFDRYEMDRLSMASWELVFDGVLSVRWNDGDDEPTFQKVSENQSRERAAAIRKAMELRS